MKKIFFSALLFILFLSSCGTSSSAENHITIWTSGEDYRNEYYLTKLQEQFPQYDFTLEYMNSSSIAAKVIEEGEHCTCDIILSEEYGYLYKCEDYLLELTDFDYSPFLNEYVPQSKKFTPEYRNGGCIIINPGILAEHNLAHPTSYEDLLKPEYEGFISMPNPTTSGTGYMFLRQLTNEWGEEHAFTYFEKLSNNILQYTSSGSGPINALIQGEAAIGLGMISQAIVEINQGVDLEVIFFDEGAPYSMYGNAILKNSANRACVMEVFQYLSTELCVDNNTLYCPEQIFKDYIPDVAGFPKNIRYGNMANDTLSEKERLLAKWTFN